MTSMARTDTSAVAHWWWTVDRWLLASVALLMAAGGVFALAASPPVAERIGLESFHFVKRHLIFLPLAGVLLLCFSMMTAVTIRRAAILMFVLFFLLTGMTLVFGPVINGSQRWLYLGGLSIQPTEFLKPAFIVVCAWMFAEQKRSPGFPGNRIAIALCVLVLALLGLQPDFGQALLMFLVWGAQFFIAGLSVAWIALLALAALIGLVFAYTALPHVASRVDRFIDPASGDTYQIDTALSAFRNGGFLGQGPGEGTVKRLLPDAHTDFIFAVIGEEFGLIACLALLVLFSFVLFRGLMHLLYENDQFVFLATAGLLVQFGLQVLINVGVNLNLMPAKGMTLPFISYGGSSLLAASIGMGMILSFSRRTRFGVTWGRPLT